MHAGNAKQEMNLTWRYDRIDISEGIDPTNGNRSKECMICHYWFFNHGFKFQDFVYNGCQDLKILCLNISHYHC